MMLSSSISVFLCSLSVPNKKKPLRQAQEAEPKTSQGKTLSCCITWSHGSRGFITHRITLLSKHMGFRLLSLSWCFPPSRYLLLLSLLLPSLPVSALPCCFRLLPRYSSGCGLTRVICLLWTSGLTTSCWRLGFGLATGICLLWTSGLTSSWRLGCARAPGICLLWTSDVALGRTSHWQSRSQPKVCNKDDDLGFWPSSHDGSSRCRNV